MSKTFPTLACLGLITTSLVFNSLSAHATPITTPPPEEDLGWLGVLAIVVVVAGAVKLGSVITKGVVAAKTATDEDDKQFQEQGIGVGVDVEANATGKGIAKSKWKIIFDPEANGTGDLKVFDGGDMASMSQQMSMGPETPGSRLYEAAPGGGLVTLKVNYSTTLSPSPSEKFLASNEHASSEMSYQFRIPELSINISDMISLDDNFYRNALGFEKPRDFSFPVPGGTNFSFELDAKQSAQIAIPEPSTILVLLSGLVALFLHSVSTTRKQRPRGGVGSLSAAAKA